MEDNIQRTQVGSKSFSATELFKLSKASKSTKEESTLNFQGPVGVVLPFGSLETILNESGMKDRAAELLSKYVIPLG